jgi:hypothetical protein
MYCDMYTAGRQALVTDVQVCSIPFEKTTKHHEKILYHDVSTPGEGSGIWKDDTMVKLSL